MHLLYLYYFSYKYLEIYCNEDDRYGKKEAGTGEHSTHFNNKINKHKWKAAAPHGRLPHTKHKLKFQAWSSLVFHCCHSSFNPSEAPPWDSRPVSGAGVVHYQLLHRPRSVPTALGPAPLVTYTIVHFYIFTMVLRCYMYGLTGYHDINVCCFGRPMVNEKKKLS